MRYKTGDVVMMLPTKHGLLNMANWHIGVVHSFLVLYGGLKIIYLVQIDMRDGMAFYCHEAELFKIGEL